VFLIRTNLDMMEMEPAKEKATKYGRAEHKPSVLERNIEQ
jgi:hypothetical protein